MYLVIVLFVSFTLIGTGITQTPCVTPNGEQGKCILFTQCAAFVKIWNNRTYKNIGFFRASRCGWEGTNPLVCCGSEAEFTTALRTGDSLLDSGIAISVPQSTQTSTSLEPINLITIPATPTTPTTPTTESIITTTPELFTNPPVFTSKKNLVSSTPSLQTSKYMSHPNSHLVPQRGSCGLQKSNAYKIFGGNDTEIDEYPWVALLGYKYDGIESFNCGGSLINERYVLTAAHCVAGRNLVSVRLGEYNVSQSPDCVMYEGYDDCAVPHQDFIIEETVWFTSYTPRDLSRWNDIALIRLNRNVTFNDFVQPICLPINGERSSNGDILTVAGWGLTELNVTSEVKLQVQVPMWSDIGCKEVYSIGYNVNLTEKQFCAGGQPGKDSCTGDSGGPLMRIYPDSEDYYVEGIVSFGPRPCGKTATPGVYIRVSEYIQWILDNMKPF